MKQKYPEELVKNINVSVRFNKAEYEELVSQYGSKKIATVFRNIILETINKENE